MTKTSVRFFYALFIFLWGFNGTNALAESASSVAPTRASLVAAWEEKLKNRPDTVSFKKTKEEGVYEFETTLFPYKGRLKILNTLIQDRDISPQGYEYDDYRDDDDSGYIGAVETELSDLEDPEGFCKKYPYSKAAWQDFNVLFFPNDAQIWMTKGEWKSHIVGKKENPVFDSHPVREEKKGDSIKKYLYLLADWGPFIFLVGFLLFLLRTTQKHRGQYDLSIDRQKIGLEKQQEALDLIRQSLETEKDQLHLLKQILEKTGK